MTATTIYFASADEYLAALWMHADMWGMGDAGLDLYRLVRA